jgi:hypothetical protein
MEAAPSGGRAARVIVSVSSTPSARLAAADWFFCASSAANASALDGRAAMLAHQRCPRR